MFQICLSDRNANPYIMFDGWCSYLAKLLLEMCPFQPKVSNHKNDIGVKGQGYIYLKSVYG